MSAERLHEAAHLMRERAAKVPSAPWRVIPDRDYTVGGGARDGYAFDTPMARVSPTYGGRLWPWEAEYVASWQPAVALAVADWLDAFAPLWDSGGTLDRERQAALALADAYLSHAESLADAP